MKGCVVLLRHFVNAISGLLSKKQHRVKEKTELTIVP